MKLKRSFVDLLALSLMSKVAFGQNSLSASRFTLLRRWLTGRFSFAARRIFIAFSNRRDSEGTFAANHRPMS
jgi:hypothetical protein